MIFCKTQKLILKCTHSVNYITDLGLHLHSISPIQFLHNPFQVSVGVISSLAVSVSFTTFFLGGGLVPQIKTSLTFVNLIRFFIIIIIIVYQRPIQILYCVMQHYDFLGKWRLIPIVESV